MKKKLLKNTKYSYKVILPKSFIKELKWNENTNIIIVHDKDNERIIIKKDE